MELTRDEEAALEGEKGETLQLAYRILVPAAWPELRLIANSSRGRSEQTYCPARKSYHFVPFLPASI